MSRWQIVFMLLVVMILLVTEIATLGRALNWW